MEKMEERNNEKQEIQLLNRIITRHEAVVIVWNMDESIYSTASFVSENVDTYGYSPDEFKDGKLQWEDLICTQDRREAEQECQYQLLNGGTRYQQEYRIQKKNGETVWVRADNVIIRDKISGMTRLEMLLYNIDEIKSREHRILEQQIALNEEVYRYVDVLERYDTIEERLSEFIKDQQIELLQNVFTDIFFIHTAIVGLDHHFYTHMTGPKEEEGIFYDIAELKSFWECVDDLNHNFAQGERHYIIMMENPKIKVSGVPIIYKGEHVATWIMCCLADKDTEQILEIIRFMKIMANTMSDYYSNHMGKQTEKGFALERYHMKQVMNGKDTLLQIYEKLFGRQKKREMISIIFEHTAKYLELDRVAFYRKVDHTIYARCEYEWNKPEKCGKEVPNQAFSIKALPDPVDILENDIVVMNSIHLESKYRDTYADLCCKAAILIPICAGSESGFATFVEIEEDRVFVEEEIEFIKEIKKIIEKVLLKSE